VAAPRILLDEDVPILLATTLRARGHDVVHATEIGQDERDDDDVFDAAIEDGRAVLTHNVGDFMEIVGRLGAEGRDHRGLVVAEQVEFRELLRRALQFLSDRDAESLVNAVVWLVR